MVVVIVVLSRVLVLVIVELAGVLIRIIVMGSALQTATRFTVGGAEKQALPQATAGKHGAPGRHRVGTVKPSPDCQLRSGMTSRSDEDGPPAGTVGERGRERQCSKNETRDEHTEDP